MINKKIIITLAILIIIALLAPKVFDSKNTNITPEEVIPRNDTVYKTTNI